MVSQLDGHDSIVSAWGVMTQTHATEQIRTRTRELGGALPRRFSQTAWWRFSRKRRREYLAELAAPLSAEQAARIESLVRLEWNALRNESEALTLQGREAREAAREAREHRRLLAKLLGDHQRSLIPKPAPRAKPPSLAEHLRRREAAAE